MQTLLCQETADDGGHVNFAGVVDIGAAASQADGGTIMRLKVPRLENGTRRKCGGRRERCSTARLLLSHCLANEFLYYFQLALLRTIEYHPVTVP